MPHHLEQGKISIEDIVEVDLWIDPSVVEMFHRDTIVFRRHDVEVNKLFVSIDALLEFAHEQIDAHDAEDQPEDETDEHDVEDGRNSLDQGVDDHLHNNNDNTQSTNTR